MSRTQPTETGAGDGRSSNSIARGKVFGKARSPANDIPAMVVSHERSGTHFLMNSLAAELGFQSNPILAFDQPVVNINFFHSDSVEKFFIETRQKQPKLVRKSHHQFAFFENVIDAVIANIVVFYVYRDPRDVAHSFRHFLNSWNWFEGPKIQSSSAFIRTPPAGQMLRYQYHQLPDMLERWRVHVEGWVNGANTHSGITTVKYEDLRDHYDVIMDSIAKKNDWTRIHGNRPQRDVNTVLKRNRDSASNIYTQEDIDYFRKRVGPTMHLLGYDF